MTYLIIGYIVLDILYAAVIPHHYIMQGCIIYSGMLPHASRHREVLPENSQTHITRKTHIPDISRRESLRNHYPGPVFCRTGL